MQFIKDPNARLDYQVDWTEWLSDSETIQTSLWIVPTGIASDDEDVTSTSATVWLTGGTAGQTYALTNRITTNQARTDDRTIQIVVRER